MKRSRMGRLLQYALGDDERRNESEMAESDEAAEEVSSESEA